MEEAKDTDTKLITFSVLLCIVIGALMALVAPLFPRLYTTDEVRRMAAIFIVEVAMFMPVNAFLHASYFTLRSGGKTIITFLFDSVFIWVVSVPVAFCLPSGSEELSDDDGNGIAECDENDVEQV